jgi:hypothetical protein
MMKRSVAAAHPACSKCHSVFLICGAVEAASLKSFDVMEARFMQKVSLAI